MKPAAYWRRALAMTVDWMVAAWAVWLLALITGQEGIGLLWQTVTVIVVAACTTFAAARGGPRNGQTLGKQLLGIRVVQADGTPLTVTGAAVREAALKCGLLVYVAVVLTDGALGLAAVIWLLWPLADRGLRRTPHDLLRSTRVVRNSLPAAPAAG